MCNGGLCRPGPLISVKPGAPNLPGMLPCRRLFPMSATFSAGRTFRLLMFCSLRKPAHYRVSGNSAYASSAPFPVSEQLLSASSLQCASLVQNSALSEILQHCAGNVDCSTACAAQCNLA